MMKQNVVKKRVCVLEDDDDIREIIIFLLETENYEVCSFATVGAFMEGARDARADAFVLDVMLPDGSGIEVCRILKANLSTCTVPVVMMSANYTKADVLHHCAAQDFISKPFDIGDFVHRVDNQAFGHIA
ncbi:PleD family two-component system response regulator [Pedobacter frigidisoli]|uniref:response regulator n=1 Tax=Pedobacter frigidisoli TaxID=2530455 RepID=UPI00292F1E1D|nr:response regulator [Pedobacter frigidisoli]